MKLNKKHFKIFVKECKRCVEKFKLDNWDIHYRFAKLDDRAQIYRVLKGYIATITLSTNWDGYDRIKASEVRECAKHEVIHLLLARLSSNGEVRFVTVEDYIESEEELVRKLEKLI